MPNKRSPVQMIHDPVGNLRGRQTSAESFRRQTMVSTEKDNSASSSSSSRVVLGRTRRHQTDLKSGNNQRPSCCWQSCLHQRLLPKTEVMIRHDEPASVGGTHGCGCCVWFLPKKSSSSGSQLEHWTNQAFTFTKGWQLSGKMQLAALAR